MVVFEQVSKQYEGHLALDKVTFRIPEGEIFGLLGPNGAGKTSLLRMITRILLPDSGSVLFKNSPLQEQHLSQIGYLPEERGLYPKMVVKEHLVFLSTLKGISRSQSLQRIDNWAEKLLIPHLLKRKIEELSKGQQQKVQLIAALLHEPELLILDEPFSGFDPVNAELLKNILLELKAAGKTLLISTHRMDNAEELCSRVVMLHQGKVVLEGPLQKVLTAGTGNRYRVVLSRPVTATEEITVEEEKGNATIISCRAGTLPNELLEVLMKQGEVLYFGAENRSLRDVFLEKAK